MAVQRLIVILKHAPTILEFTNQPLRKLKAVFGTTEELFKSQAKFFKCYKDKRTEIAKYSGNDGVHSKGWR